MITLRRILVPTDFSAVSEKALTYGKEFAASFDAHLHLFHVVQRPGPRKVNEQLERHAMERLEETLPIEERKRIGAELVVRGGEPYHEIIRYAESEEIDLIIMGTHAFGPVAHMILGSITEKVARKAPCPMMIVRESENEFIEP
jgi:universal stress protein A